MAYDLQAGVQGLRAEVIDSLVKQIAARTYKFKQACAVVPTSAWKNTFFREQTAIPAGQTGNLTAGIPRGAAFPQYTIGWDEYAVRITKHGLEESLPWEDILSDEINVQARTVIRITEGVVKSVDDSIWTALIGDTAIQTFDVAPTHGAWDEASAAIIWDLMKASRLIAENNYDTGDLMCFVSPADKVSIMNWLAGKGAQFPSIATGIVENGRLGSLVGIQLIESNSVTPSQALVLKPKTCATIKELVSMRSDTTTDPYKSVRIRVVEELATEITDPKCIVWLKGTQDLAQ
jgi:hypothetical protein